MSYKPFDPSPFAANSFRHTFGPVEASPLGYAGNSHFGYCNTNCYTPGWHVTTQIPGFGKAEGLANGLRDHYFFKKY